MSTTTTNDTFTSHRPGPASWRLMLVSEFKMVMRNPLGLVLSLGLPLLLVLISGSSAGRQVVGDSGLSRLEVLVLPLALAMTAGVIGVIALPSRLVHYRRSGVLRHLATTPASPAMVLVAQMIISLAQALIGAALVTIVAVGLFGAHLPVALWTALGIFALMTAAFSAVGLIVATMAPTPSAGIAIGSALFFAIAALGGIFGGRDALPDALTTVGEFLPFGAAVEALSATWQGQPVEAAHLVAMGISILVGVVVAVVLFRWDR